MTSARNPRVLRSSSSLQTVVFTTKCYTKRVFSLLIFRAAGYLQFSVSLWLCVFCFFHFRRNSQELTTQKQKQKTQEKVAETQKDSFWVLKRQKQPRSLTKYLCLIPVLIVCLQPLSSKLKWSPANSIFDSYKSIYFHSQLYSEQVYQHWYEGFSISVCSASVIIQREKKCEGGIKLESLKHAESKIQMVKYFHCTSRYWMESFIKKVSITNQSLKRN